MPDHAVSSFRHECSVPDTSVSRISTPGIPYAGYRSYRTYEYTLDTVIGFAYTPTMFRFQAWSCKMMVVCVAPTPHWLVQQYLSPSIRIFSQHSMYAYVTMAKLAFAPSLSSFVLRRGSSLSLPFARSLPSFVLRQLASTWETKSATSRVGTYQ